MATLLEITPNQPGMTRDGQRFCARTAALMLNAPLGWETGFSGGDHTQKNARDR